MKTYIDEHGWQYAVRPGLGNNMNELIKIETNENGDVRVSGRELKARIDPKTEIIFDESVDEPHPVIAVKEE